MWGCSWSGSRVANLNQMGENFHVINLITIAFFVIWALGVESATSAESSSAMPNSTRLKIKSVSADGKNYSWLEGKEVRLPSFPDNIAFGYGAASSSNRVPTRLRYKLEGYDHEWHESWGQMFLAIRFLDELGEQIARKTWNVSGESPGGTANWPVLRSIIGEKCWWCRLGRRGCRCQFPLGAPRGQSAFTL